MIKIFIRAGVRSFSKGIQINKYNGFVRFSIDEGVASSSSFSCNITCSYRSGNGGYPYSYTRGAL